MMLGFEGLRVSGEFCVWSVLEIITKRWRIGRGKSLGNIGGEDMLNYS